MSLNEAEMNKLKSILDDLKKTKAVSEADVLGGDPRTPEGKAALATVQSRQMKKHQAQRKLPDIRSKLQTSMNSLAYVVFVTGKKTDALVSKVCAQIESVAVNFNDIFGDVKWAANAALGKSRVWNVNAHTAMVTRTRQIGQELGLTYIPDVPFPNRPRALNSKEECDEFVDSLLLENIGAELISAAVSVRAVKLAEDSMTGTQNVFPVFVYNISGEMSQAIGTKVLGGKFSVFESQSGAATDKEATSLLNVVKRKNNKKNQENTAKKEEELKKEEEENDN